MWMSLRGGSRRAWLVGGLVAVLSLAVVAGAAGGKRLKTRSASTSVEAIEAGSVTAQCKRGTKAVSGGYEGEIDTDPGPIFIPAESRRDGGGGWTATAFNFSVTEGILTGFAYCRDQDVKSFSESTTLAEGESDTVVATCPRGMNAISGGFDGEFELGGSTIAPNVSRKLGKRSWEVSARNPQEAGTLTSQVNCYEGKALRTKEAVETIDDDPTATAIAKCKRKQRVVSGGFAQDPLTESGPFAYESQKQGRRTWRVSVFASVPTEFTAYAYCEKKKKR
jgi:hypothetical protein